MTNASPQPKPNSAPLGGGQGARLNKLGLNRRDLEALLDQIDSAPTPAADAAVRLYIRRRFRHLRIPMQIIQPGGTTATFPVACRNISRGGLSVLHSAYLHLGTACAFALPIPAGGHFMGHGKVVRCQHRRGMIHEIGVAFDSPIDLRPLLDMDILSDWFSREKVDPAELKGTLLYVEDSASDRRLVRYFLRETNLTVVTADDPAQGLDKALDGADAILCDFTMPKMDGGAFIDQLRAKGVTAPVIMFTADTGDAVKRRLSAIPASAFIAKPIAQDLLIRALAEFLLVTPEAGGPAQPASASPGHGPPAKFIQEFLKDLQSAAETLESMSKGSDADGCRRLCIRLKISAPMMGFANIASLADAVLAAIGASKSLADAAQPLDKLIAAAKSTNARMSA